MLLSLLSSILLILSFPNFNFSYLVFIGFVPLFFALENKSPKKAFLIFFICGFIFYLGTLYWLYHVTIIGLIILCLYLALYFGLFGLIFNYFILHPSLLTLIFIPFAWVILEYIQANISILGFGWALLGYSQYKNLLLIQIADFSGAYGVSFVIMMVNVGFYMSLRGAKPASPASASASRRRDGKRGERRSNSCKKITSPAFGLLAMTSLVLIASYAYGFFRLNERHGANSIKVSVIQGNILQELKWDPAAQGMIIEKYTALTKMSGFDNPDLIVWPETSFPGFFEIDKEMTNKVLNLAKEINIPVLIGVNTEKDGKYFNSAVLISGQEKIVDRYDKIHLVPFGEYVPFSDKFPVFHKLVLGEFGEFTPGKDFKVFKLKAYNLKLTADFGVLICFEDIFPELSRKFVKNGARFMVVITNDAWYGRSGAAYQHAACSVFRAIENRVPIVRCANTGYSCFIDSKGKIYDSVGEKGSHLFVTSYKTSALLIK